MRTTRTAAAFGTVLIATLLACCARQAPSAPPSPPEPTASLPDPREVVLRFRDVLRAESVATAMSMVDVMDYTAPAADQVRRRLSRLGREMADDGFDFRPVDAKSEGDAALVIVRETPGRKNPGPPAFNAMFLILRDEGWRLSPEPTKYEKIRGLTAVQAASFEALDRWFQYRKADLKMEARELGK